ncbi:MAG: hypothetical protein ACK5OB_07895 [Pirellula sp.]
MRKHIKTFGLVAPSTTMAIALLVSTCSVGWEHPLRADDGPTPVTRSSQVDDEKIIKLTIHPKAEAKPSLKIQLVPDAASQLEGNAALFYLKAMGFLEQNSARDRIREMYKLAAEQAAETCKQSWDFPPDSYVDMHPADYPKKAVHEYVDGLLGFQVPSLREARLYGGFSMNRNLALSDNPVGYLLPEMQTIRELARTQRIRCRLAIAEGRVDDAIEIIGQQLTMSRHIATDDFLVSHLVGVAILGIAMDDTLHLITHENCPNLYWAFAQLPDPLVASERCLAFERQFVYQQIPKLKEIDATPRPQSYWTEFVAEFADRTVELDRMSEGSDRAMISKVQGDGRLKSIRNSIEGNVSQAKEYLLSRGIVTPQNVHSYPDEQLVFVAMKDYYDVLRDDMFKLFHIPFLAARDRFASTNERLKKDRERFGWFVGLADVMLSNLEGFPSVQFRAKQRVALIQAIEAIRMAGAENGGKLIDSLEQAPVPVPNDPFTGKPFSYRMVGDTAVLSSEYPASWPAQIELRMAK